MTSPNIPERDFYLMQDKSYNRMMAKLESGERYVKSFLGDCPHRNNRKCDCKFFLNFLDDGVMTRVVNGKRKFVVPMSLYRREVKGN